MAVVGCYLFRLAARSFSDGDANSRCFTGSTDRDGTGPAIARHGAIKPETPGKVNAPGLSSVTILVNAPYALGAKAVP